MTVRVTWHGDGDWLEWAVLSRTGVSGAITSTAVKAAKTAAGIAAQHTKTGQLLHSIDIDYAPARRSQYPVMDRLVVINDPNALSIEFGHYQGRMELGDNREWVKGLHVLGRTMKAMKAK